MKDYEQLTQMTNEFLHGISSNCEAIYESEKENIVVRRRGAYEAEDCCDDGIGCIAPLTDFARANGLGIIVTSRPRRGTYLLEDHSYPCVILF